MRALVDEARLGVHVVAFLVDLERTLVEVGREPAGSAIAGRGRIVKDQGGGMSLGEIERTTRLEEMGDDTRPLLDIRQPTDRAPGNEEEIERGRLGDCLTGGVDVGQYKASAGGKAKLGGERTGRRDGGRRKIQADDGGAALGEAEAVAAEMTLQVQDA